MKIIKLLFASAALAWLMVVPAAAQTSGPSPCAPGGPNNSSNPQNSQYPPRDCGVGADRSEVGPGGKVKLTGQCPSGTESVEFRLVPGNANLGSAKPDADGNYSAEVTIPANARPGDYRIEARCQGVLGAGVVRSVTIRVVGAAALPRTGTASIVPLGGVGTALVVTGGLAVLAVRRRRGAFNPS